MEHFISYKNACKIIGLSLVLALVSSTAYSQEGTPMKSVQQGLASIKPVISLSGAALTPPTLGEDTRKRLEENLAKAQAAYDANPDDLENIIWLGRRTSYLWGYHEAIGIYTEGLRKFPDNYKLLRHRGHRYISVRAFGKAIADLERATELIEGVQDQVELDGAPNKYNIPTSSNHFNIWYHLGLAYYLIGDFENALRCYEKNKDFVYNYDALVANTDWLYMINRRLGREQEAMAVLEPVRNDMNILENDAYFKRILMYKGEITPEELLDLSGDSDLANELNLVTQGYGVANWYLYNGQTEEAQILFKRIVDNPYWSAFGYIAGEAELNPKSVE